VQAIKKTVVVSHEGQGEEILPWHDVAHVEHCHQTPEIMFPFSLSLLFPPLPIIFKDIGVKILLYL
jgi:hypothetical protein